MNKLFLIKNQELFQGENCLNKNYFEGWYFKNTNKEKSICFIPGINIEGKNKKAFIQVITNNLSYFINYDIKEFKFCHVPFKIQIGKSIFTKEGIHIEISDDIQKLQIYGNLKYSNTKNISTNILNPNIMGPFSYIPFMECNHAIINMQNDIIGKININSEEIEFNKGIGYIEKDWGSSFPKSYIWCQGNNFNKTKSSFMLSIADIPFKFFNFKGIICVLKTENEEFKFTTYNNTKIEKYLINDKSFDISLKKDKYLLNIKSNYDNGNKLLAPVKGKMNKDILESVTANITVILKQDNNELFHDMSRNCGLEIV